MIYLKNFEAYNNYLVDKFKNNNWTFADILAKHEEEIYIKNTISNYLDMIIGKEFSYIDEISYHDDCINIDYYNILGDDKSYTIEKDKIDDFMNFLNNQEAYIDAKKYNL